MPETLSVRPVICDQIRSGPLGRWVDDFVDVSHHARIRDQHGAPARASCGDLQRLAGPAAGRSDGH